MESIIGRLAKQQMRWVVEVSTRALIGGVVGSLCDVIWKVAFGPDDAADLELLEGIGLRLADLEGVEIRLLSRLVEQMIATRTRLETVEARVQNLQRIQAASHGKVAADVPLQRPRIEVWLIGVICAAHTEEARAPDFSVAKSDQMLRKAGRMRIHYRVMKRAAKRAEAKLRRSREAANKRKRKFARLALLPSNPNLQNLPTYGRERLQRSHYFHLCQQTFPSGNKMYKHNQTEHKGDQTGSRTNDTTASNSSAGSSSAHFGDSSRFSVPANREDLKAPGL
ncbi:uncharacterized protein RCC_05912 [Ramularia collo-cygni]|uniref:Uncharacterized protein n=1 Tax=Ramularia collo-cygni TaxID=112498 RepID=A0A2D3V018_9PEZI|nr:uncharacterized protein RCC_05912 [Ramularia collo-cygni]CZT20055.1 uncharacterized protein RCC_05912 [Ramularia collo-cygni]